MHPSPELNQVGQHVATVLAHSSQVPIIKHANNHINKYNSESRNKLVGRFNQNHKVEKMLIAYALGCLCSCKLNMSKAFKLSILIRSKTYINNLSATFEEIFSE